jgi:hypothetical protein
VEWPGALCFTNDEGNAYSVQGVWPAPDSWANERTPIWGRWLRPKATFVVCLFFAFSNDRVHAIASARLWWRRETVLFRAARIWWENLWDATFTCGNDEFSGFLPEVDSNIDAQNRLYYNGSGV